MSATTRRRGPGGLRPGTVAVCVVLFSTGAPALLCVAIRRSALPAVIAVAASGCSAAALFLMAARRRPRPAVDRAVPHLPAPRPTPASGVYIGRSLRGGRELRASWEDMHLDIWGPRTGKTASRAIPAVVSAPGSVVVTSNKRDIVDATRGVRAGRGPVWVFDPQNQAGEPPSWWWNPLTFVGESIGSAVMLASFFSGINRQAHVRSDGYFQPAAESLFGGLLLAASVEHLPISRTLAWLQRPDDDTPERILRAHGHDQAAMSIAVLRGAPPLQRVGVYGTAMRIASPLRSPSVLEWVTPGRDPGRPEFSHTEFARRDDSTIYLLSEESDRSAAPFLVALISGLAYAIEGRAIGSPGGRLPTPSLFVLDEVANVCPWHELPYLYSHYGSRGIVMMTFLQSWAQGAAVWGEAGMASLWGSANVRVYGGGSADAAFLRDLSQATPTFQPLTTQVTRPAGRLFGGTTTQASRAEPVLDVADLARLPRGRALVQLSGSGPVLVETVPWWQGPHAGGIAASLATHSPKAA